MIKIYHNPRCRKSRAGLQYLEGKGVEFEVVEYLKNEISEEEDDMLGEAKLRILKNRNGKANFDIPMYITKSKMSIKDKFEE